MHRAGLLALVFLLLMPLSAPAEEITLVKHASRAEPAGFTRYTVQSGDTLWKILMRTQNARSSDLPYLYRKFRELNPGITNLNYIMAGQKISVPHLPGGEERDLSVEAAPEDVYVIKKGQHLAMILREVYGLSDKRIFNEYLDLIKELNPEIEDLDVVEIGQKIRMPEIRKDPAAPKTTAGSREPGKTVFGGDMSRRPDVLLHELIEEKVDEMTRRRQAAERGQTEEPEVTGPGREEQADRGRGSAASILEVSRRSRQAPEEVIRNEASPLPAQTPLPGTEMIFEEKEKAPEKKPAPAKKRDIGRVPKEAPAPERRSAPPAAVQGPPPVAAAKDLEKRAAAGTPPGMEEAAEQGAPAGTGVAAAQAEGGDRKDSVAARLVRKTLLPALTRMGGRQKDQGTYFMPMAGGSSISIDTTEIPVIELDTGMRVILDINDRISPDVRTILEQAFPSCRIISGRPEGLESLMDRILDVAGYFSINKDAGPLLVGEEEKVRFSGKWIVYKDFSRRNVFVINLLDDHDQQTPDPIRHYASRFGIDLIEMGGKPWSFPKEPVGSLIELNGSYGKLFDLLGTAYERDRELTLVSIDALKISYKAPLLYQGKIILAEELPDNTMSDLLAQKGFTVIHTAQEPLETVLDKLGIERQGPPVKTVVADRRAELELPALQVGGLVVLLCPLDADIASYLASTGMKIALWQGPVR